MKIDTLAELLAQLGEANTITLTHDGNVIVVCTLHPLPGTLDQVLTVAKYAGGRFATLEQRAVTRRSVPRKRAPAQWGERRTYYDHAAAPAGMATIARVIREAAAEAGQLAPLDAVTLRRSKGLAGSWEIPARGRKLQRPARPVQFASQA